MTTEQAAELIRVLHEIYIIGGVLAFASGFILGIFVGAYR